MKYLVALFVVALLVTAGCGASTNSTSGAPAGKSSLKVVAAQSWCVPNPADASMTFFVTIRNTGTKDGKTQIIPWRRYSDASVNDGIGDQTGDVKVAAGKTSKTRTVVPVDATKHTVLECRVILGSGFEHPTKIAVIV